MREEGSEGGTKEGSEGARERGSEGAREGGREGLRESGREGGREGGRLKLTGRTVDSAVEGRCLLAPPLPPYGRRVYLVACAWESESV